MPRHLHHIGNDAVVANLAIVGHMHIFHEQIVVTHHSVFLHVVGAVDGDKLPDLIAAADTQTGGLSLELEVLGVCAQNSIRGYLVVIPDRGVSGEDHVGDEDVAVAKDHRRPYMAPGADLAVSPDLRALINDCRGVDLSHLFLSWIMAMKSPSATLVRPT